MRIEDTPFQFGNTLPVEKNYRSGSAHNPTLDAMLSDLDLSFLDLISAQTAELKAEPVETAGKVKEVDATGKSQTTQKEGISRPRLSVVDGGKSQPLDANAPTQVEKDMVLLNADLTAEDIQYLKQAVIPGLPILLGSVPVNNIFPAEDGQISYKGFEVSPKLSELIEKGYKTGRPIRVELDPKSAVVLKIRNGQVSAEFVSTDRSMAFVMQQELDDLRHRMALKNLPVGTLEYKYQEGRRQQQQAADDEQNASD